MDTISKYFQNRLFFHSDAPYKVKTKSMDF